MKPRIQIVYSFVYAKLLLGITEHEGLRIDEFKKTWEKVKKCGEAFEKRLPHYVDDILTYIPRLSGYQWKEKDSILKVYIVSFFPSFSDPLTITADKSVHRMLALFVHELCHVNLPHGSDVRENEQKINEVMQDVFKNLGDKNLLEEGRRIITATREKFGIPTRKRSDTRRTN